MPELPRRAVGGLTALALITVASCARRSHPGASATGPASGVSASAPFPGRPVIGFVGDSFSFGTGASTPARRWTTRLCGAERWNEANVAIPGMGYVAGGRTQAYAGQVAALAPHRPDVVVISGGWNDVAHGFSTARVLAGLSETLTATKRLIPRARVVVIAPVGPATAPPAGLLALRDAARGVVERAGATYVDLDFPLTGRPEWISGDGLHPNDAGYARLAELTAPALRRALPA